MLEFLRQGNLPIEMEKESMMQGQMIRQGSEFTKTVELVRKLKVVDLGLV